MPAVSKKQFRFMKAVASGKARNKPEGLSPEEAEEYTKKNKGSRSPKNLPEQASKKRRFKVLSKKG